MRTDKPTPASPHGVTSSNDETSNTNYDDSDLDLGYDLDDYDVEEDELTEPTSPLTTDSPLRARNNHGHGHQAARKDILFTPRANNFSGPLARGFGAVSENKGSRSAPEVEREEDSGYRTESRRYGSGVRRILTGGGTSANFGRELTVCLLCLEMIR